MSKSAVAKIKKLEAKIKFLEKKNLKKEAEFLSNKTGIFDLMIELSEKIVQY